MPLYNLFHDTVIIFCCLHPFGFLISVDILFKKAVIAARGCHLSGTVGEHENDVIAAVASTVTTAVGSENIVQRLFEPYDLPQRFQPELRFDLLVEKLGRVGRDPLQTHDPSPVVALKAVLQLRHPVPRQPRVHVVVRPVGRVLGRLPA